VKEAGVTHSAANHCEDVLNHGQHEWKEGRPQSESDGYAVMFSQWNEVDAKTPNGHRAQEIPSHHQSHSQPSPMKPMKLM